LALFFFFFLGKKTSLRGVADLGKIPSLSWIFCFTFSMKREMLNPHSTTIYCLGINSLRTREKKKGEKGREEEK